MKTHWYEVSSILRLIIYLRIISYVAWPFVMNVLNSGIIIMAQCAVVVSIGLIGLIILSLLALLEAMIEVVVKNSSISWNKLD